MDLVTYLELLSWVAERLLYLFIGVSGGLWGMLMFAMPFLAMGMIPVILLYLLGGLAANLRSGWLRRRRSRVMREAPEDVVVRVDELDGRTGCWIEVEGACRMISLANADSREARHWSPTRTGDAAFDAAWRTLGPPAEVRARLDAGTRSVLTRSLRRGDRVAEGVVSLRLDAAEEWPQRLAEAREIAFLLGERTAESVRASLVAAAMQDPVDGARARALEALLQLGPDEPTCRALLDDPSRRVRAVAARGVPDGRPLLEALADDADAGVRALAVPGLALHGGNARLAAHLAAHLADAPAVALAVDPRDGEALLVALLRTRAWRAAAMALADHGTLDALPALRARGGSECRRAIAEIQSRTDLVEGGELSLAGGGELSMAGGGELALAGGGELAVYAR